MLQNEDWNLCLDIIIVILLANFKVQELSFFLAFELTINKERKNVRIVKQNLSFCYNQIDCVQTLGVQKVRF